MSTPTRITTVEELDALPATAVLITETGEVVYPWQGHRPVTLLRQGPLTVVYTP